MSQRIWFHRYCYPTQCLISASLFSIAPFHAVTIDTPPPKKIPSDKQKGWLRVCACREEWVSKGQRYYFTGHRCRDGRGPRSSSECNPCCCLSGLLLCLPGEAGDLRAASRPPSHLKIKPGVKKQQMKRCKTRK